MLPLIFDIVLVGIILWGIGLVAFERYGSALLTMLGLLVGAWFVFEPFKSFVLSIGWKILLLKWVPIYLAAGVLVALIKWFFHVWKTASAIGDAKESFKDRSGSDDTNVARRRQGFVHHFMSSVSYSSPEHMSTADIDSISDRRWNEESIVAELLTPRAKKHMNRISFWVLEWPYVIIATIFDDILIKFAQNVARFFDWAFTAASRFWIDRVTKGI